MKIRLKTKYIDCECEVDLDTYYNGATRLILVDRKELGVVAVASINVPDYLCQDGTPLGPKRVIIKDYSENEGMLQALLDAGVVEETPDRCVLSPYVTAVVCKLLI